MSEEILKTQKILSGDEKPIFVGFPNDEYLFQKFKTGFILNHLADNIYFCELIRGPFSVVAYSSP